MPMLYEGKAKQVFDTEIPDTVLISFKDDATAFNGVKKDVFDGKGRVNLEFTRYFFNLLKNNGINTHIIEFMDKKSFTAHKLQIIPLEVVVRNFAAGSISKRLGFKKGMPFEPPLCEFYLKDDSLNDPVLCRTHLPYLKIATENEIDEIEASALKINDILYKHLDKRNITLVDFKLEFGRNLEDKIMLADEISPDTCRFWIKGTMESLDKDVYRENKGDLVSSYLKLAEILEIKI
jgi:phosphoribosylaminoimidazole-succinocarboxamide synthase